ncbi:MAG: hypothetical protein H7328_03955 [Bdellovibrio sp.]|nr:hypothetical protein [Bdellovibrio sp.]
MSQLLNNLLWIEELLPDSVISKNLLGGVAYYLDEKQVLILIESGKTRVYKGIEYPFEIWNGCLFPIEKIKQNTVYAKFQFLENHPASKNWLYLPADTEEFEDKIRQVIRELKKRNPLFGSVVKESAAGKRARLETDDDDIDTSKPRLFNNESSVSKAPQVKKAVKPAAKPTKKVKADKKSENYLLLSVLKRNRK